MRFFLSLSLEIPNEEISTLFCDTGGGGGPVVNPVGDPPMTFTKKLMLEMFKGEWNPNCPTGDDTLKAMLALDTNIIAACIHQGDWLAITPFFNAISMHLGGITSFPRATLNRLPATKGSQLDSVVYSIYNWRINLEELLKIKSTDVGLAISSKEINNNLEVSVFVGYNDSIKKKTRLTVYLIEDSVKAQNQLNADTNYVHQRVLRKVMTSNTGDSIAMFDGKMITKNYSMTLGRFYSNKSNLRIVAFVNTIGDDFKFHEVLNVQQAKLNEVKKWD